MDIKKLETPIGLILIQYECEACNLKSYINYDDLKQDEMRCPFCLDNTKKKRIFEIEIKKLGEY